MKFIDFFAGIGGISLGLERAGHECVGHCEIDPYARKVLKKHWPNVPLFGDITKVRPNELPKADLWAGGFPCQDISNAGKRAGIRGARSGLFFDWMRLVRMVRPQYLLMENVSALLYRGMGDVLGELADSGYDAGWDCIPAAAVGAPHRRDRVFIVAHPAGDGWKFLQNQAARDNAGELLSYYEQSGYRWRRKDVGHSLDSAGWTVEPDVRGSDDGIPAESHGDGLRCLGNAVVPQVAELLGRTLTDMENEKQRKNI